CTGLTSIEIPDSVTSIGAMAFASCLRLAGIDIPDSVTSIGDYAFSSCDSLTSIVIPDSVTSIGGYAFRYCDSLASICLPGNVTSIGRSVFLGCRNLAYVYYYGTQENWLNISGSSNYEELINTDIIFMCYLDIINTADGETFRGGVKRKKCIDHGTVFEILGFPAKLYTDEACTNEFDFSMPLAGDTVLYAVFDNTLHSHSFVDYDGNVLYENSVLFGAVIAPPADPVRPATDEFTYRFIGWEGFTEGMTQTAETLTFTAQYEEITIIAKGDVTADGTINRQDLLRLAKYFAGWDVEISEEASDVTGDGSVNRQDLLRLAKYFAGWDVTLG
ncbi:MAG: leucine-rich repeat protein, partial [Clostridia bacterium]|nr:leucine-rich repeat protein [Clostridia bacterium]